MSLHSNQAKRYNINPLAPVQTSVKEILQKKEGTLKKSKPIFFKFFGDPNNSGSAINSKAVNQNEKGTPKKSSSNSCRKFDPPGTIEIKKIQSNFEENLEKVKNLKFTEKKRSNRVTNPNEKLTTSKFGTYLADVPSFRRHKTENQEMIRDYQKHDISNVEGNSNSRNSFSFKGTPRLQEENINCVNHEDKKAKYLLSTNSAPFFVCSKCAVKYANNGFALRSIEDNGTLNEFYHIPAIFDSLKPGFQRVKQAITDKKVEATQFYEKQMSKVENLFNSTIKIIQNHFDIAKKTVDIYKSRTLERLELLNSDLNQNCQLLSTLDSQLSKNSSFVKNLKVVEKIDKLKASLESYFNEELVLYKFCTDTSKMENLFNHMFPYHFIFPKYCPLINCGQTSLIESCNNDKTPNKRMSSFISNTAGSKIFEILSQEESDSKKKNIVSVLEKIHENQEKNNQYYMKILKGSSIPSPKNKTFAYPYQENSQEYNYKNRSMQLFPEHHTRSYFPKPQISKQNLDKDEKGYIIFEENSDALDLRCYEKRSSLSSPNFNSL